MEIMESKTKFMQTTIKAIPGGKILWAKP